MSRDFPRAVKRAALLRAEQRCEAVGQLYGLPDGQRCNAAVAYGFDFDHVVLHANSGDSSLENCAVVCRVCHKIKSANHDTPLAAKTVRQQDKNDGIRKRPKFRKPPPGYGYDWGTGRYVKLERRT